MTETQINKILEKHSYNPIFKHAKILNLNGNDYVIAFKHGNIIHRFDNGAKFEQWLAKQKREKAKAKPKPKKR